MDELIIIHPGGPTQGFFSNCSIILYNIISFYNRFKKLPSSINTHNLFEIYKNPQSTDIRHLCFETSNLIDISITEHIEINVMCYQFDKYKDVKYELITPFVKKYFKPSIHIVELKEILKKKYNINPNNCIGVYYRGTDKYIETQLESFENYVYNIENIIQKNNGNIILQTDSAPFLDFVLSKKLNAKIIIIKENGVSYGKIGTHYERTREENYADIQYLLATILILSECKYIITSSGNVSIWMMFFRGNAHNVFQNLDLTWHSSSVFLPTNIKRPHFSFLKNLVLLK